MSAQAIYVGRQPILDRDMNIYGYELLFREGNENKCIVDDENAATARVLEHAVLDIGLEKIVGSGRAFLNLTKDYILTAEVDILPKDNVVLEILENVKVDEKIISAVKALKEKGFLIALDDFVYDESYEPLLDLVAIVKVDVLGRSSEEIEQDIVKLRGRGIVLLAEKVEGEAEYKELKAQGFDLFQGFFFARPTILKEARIPKNRIAAIELLGKINKPTCEIKEVAELVQSDVFLSVKTLKYLNSPAVGLRRRVTSLRQGVVLIGLDTIRNWVALIRLANIEDIPSEIVTTAIVRAEVCKGLSKAVGRKDADSYYTVGLLSILDVVMRTSMSEAIKPLALADDVVQAVLRKEGDRGDALKCVLALEKGTLAQAEYRQLEFADVSNIWLQAMVHANETAGYVLN